MNNTNITTLKINTAKAIAEYALSVANTEAQKESAKDRLATLELVEQYYGNPAFKAALESHVYSLNG